FPAWDLVDVEAYYDAPRFTPSYARREYMSLFTSRGCPYRCTYCHDIFSKKFNAHSPERVMAEIDAIVENYGVGELVIVDDIFNIDRKRAQKICEMIVERGYDFRLEFPNGLRADQMSEELLHWMKKAGTYRVVYAIETASPRLQKFTKKHVNLVKMNEIITMTAKMGIFTHGVHMLGFPGETREELETTIQYACKSNLHTANFFVVNPFDGTELADQVREMGIPVNVGDSNNFDYFKNNFKLSEVGTDELMYLVRKAHMRFYWSPRRIVRLMWVLPNKRLFPRMFLLFMLRSVTFLGSPGDGQRYLDGLFRMEAIWGRFASKVFPPRHKQAKIFREKQKEKKRIAALAANEVAVQPAA
ncbi:MAG: radical SAM protein, partial [Myxococcales bacterium]|nr:radical SAM protein [Myxococcales bacterium]